MLWKGTVEEVAPSLGYYSQMFIVPKKDGSWHSIINLKRLNKTHYALLLDGYCEGCRITPSAR